MLPKAQYSQSIKEEASRLGFSFCGMAKADFLELEATRLETWLKEQKNGKMQYMENYFDMRLDPRKLVEGAKSVISLLYNYHQPKSLFDSNNLKISSYAYGHDYHSVIKDKLKSLLRFIKDTIGDINGRAFVDSAPILEKVWAVKSGLGWMGKNTNLIHKGNGSYYFLSELVLDLELDYEYPVTDHCGTCTACLDACPTQAIIAPYQVDGSKCISYFTIELKEAIPVEMKGKFENWIFGCDVCMDVCPWNRFAKPHKEPLFEPTDQLSEMTKSDWIELTKDVFDHLFNNSPLKRTKYNGLKRNIDFIINT